MIPATMAHADEHIEKLRRVIMHKQRIMIVGGPSGFFGPTIQNEPGIVHHVSTERSNNEMSFTLPHRVGAVIVTRFLSHRLSAAVVDACKERGVPVFGIFRAPGPVVSILRQVFGWKHPDKGHDTMSATLGDIAPQLAEIRGGHDDEEVTEMPQPVQSVAAPPLRVVTVPTPVIDESEAEIVRLFQDVKAAVALAEETAINAMRKAREEAARAQENAQAAQVLATLKGLLK